MHAFDPDRSLPKAELYRELVAAADALPERNADARRLAAERPEHQLVADVNAFAGHIACDAASRSELVVPVLRDHAVISVIDLDSPFPGRFDADDRSGIEALAALVAARI